MLYETKLNFKSWTLINQIIARKLKKNSKIPSINLKNLENNSPFIMIKSTKLGRENMIFWKIDYSIFQFINQNISLFLVCWIFTGKDGKETLLSSFSIKKVSEKVWACSLPPIDCIICYNIWAVNYFHIKNMILISYFYVQCHNSFWNIDIS